MVTLEELITKYGTNFAIAELLEGTCILFNLYGRKCAIDVYKDEHGTISSMLRVMD